MNTQNKLLQLKPGLLGMGDLNNAHQVSLRARVSVQTAYKYLTQPETIKAVDLTVLAKLLIDGLGLNEKQVLDLKVGDLFKMVKDADQ